MLEDEQNIVLARGLALFSLSFFYIIYNQTNDFSQNALVNTYINTLYRIDKMIV